MSALATPIVRRFETWGVDGDGAEAGLLRQGGFCETLGPVDAGAVSERIASGQGALGRVLATAVPAITERAVDEAGAVGAAARQAGLQSLVALPVSRQGRVVAVVGWYF